MDERLERARLKWTRSTDSHTDPRHVNGRTAGSKAPIVLPNPSTVRSATLRSAACASRRQSAMFHLLKNVGQQLLKSASYQKYTAIREMSPIMI